MGTTEQPLQHNVKRRYCMHNTRTTFTFVVLSLLVGAIQQQVHHDVFVPVQRGAMQRRPPVTEPTGQFQVSPGSDEDAGGSRVTLRGGDVKRRQLVANGFLAIQV